MPRIEHTLFPSVDGDGSDLPVRGVTISDWQLGRVHLPPLDQVIFPDLDAPVVAEEADLAALKRQRERDQQHAAVLDEARKRGFAQGYAEGLEQGRAEGLEQARAAAQAERTELEAELRAVLGSLARAREELLVSVELDLAEIVLTLAGELGGGALEVEPARVVELARQGMNLLAESDTITLRAAAGPAALLRGAQAALVAETGAAALRVAEDPGLETTGCVVESELARVDLRVSQRLKAARDLLTKSRGEG